MILPGNIGLTMLICINPPPPPKLIFHNFWGSSPAKDWVKTGLQPFSNMFVQLRFCQAKLGSKISFCFTTPPPPPPLFSIKAPPYPAQNQILVFSATLSENRAPTLFEYVCWIMTLQSNIGLTKSPFCFQPPHPPPPTNSLCIYMTFTSFQTNTL